MNRRWSQAVADLFPETGGWVEASDTGNLKEAAMKMLTALTDWLGTETEARKALEEAMPELLSLLPKRRRGRPKTVSQQRKDEALLCFYDWKVAEGKTIRGVARSVHKLGSGKSVESVERKLHRLLDLRRSTHQKSSSEE